MFKIIKDDITKINCEAIMIPSNGIGLFKNSLSKYILNKAGHSILEQSVEKCFKQGYYKAGEAYITSAGNLKNIKKIIHLVIHKKHADKIDIDECRKAIISGMIIAKQNNIKTINISSIGAQPRKNSYKDVAKMMIQTLKPFEKDFNINIVDTNKEFIENLY
jgi:O-acetyl-ADP-ribose deacetylase (regulator of RNase III)